MAGDLAAFLLARIAEDEAVARSNDVASWTVDEDGCCVIWPDSIDNIETHFNGTAEHIATHDPARVLAECEAKRRIVELHRAIDAGSYGVLCSECGSGEPHEYPTNWPCLTLRALGLPYVDYPDFREEWRP